MNIFAPGIPIESHPSINPETAILVYRDNCANVVKILTRDAKALEQYLAAGENGKWKTYRLNEEYLRFGPETRMMMIENVWPHALATPFGTPRGAL